jgi:phosphoglucomutase/phosphomannomutase
MSDRESLAGEIEAICERVREAVGAESATTAEARLRDWLSPSTPYLDVEESVAALGRLSGRDIYDEFWRLLPFGTGGRRGHVGFGPNRINPSTSALTIQGHAEFLKSSYAGEVRVVVANDVRCFNDISERYRALESNPLLGLSSRSLALQACEIYAANGIVAIIGEPHSASAVLTTPELSFAIRALGAQGGVMFSASHNHPDDNGIKVYDSSGAQPIAPVDQELTEVIEAVGDVDALPLEEALSSSRVQDIPADVRSAYLALYAPPQTKPAPEGSRAVVFTPLCGSGDSTAGEVLRRLEHEVLVPPDEVSDGRFAAIPYRSPNPEVGQATAPARAFADEKGAEVVFSSDPDADRLGVDVKQEDGSWVHLTGNQIAGILAYYLMLDESGPQRRGIVITTNVTTRLISAVAEAAGCEVVDDLLVGFKYISNVLFQLDRVGEYDRIAGKADELVLGAEESHGLMTTSAVRDKDAASGIVHLAALYQQLALEKVTLFDYYLSVLDRIGYFAEANRSIVMLGEEGLRNTAKLMESLRADPIDEIAGRTLIGVTDYLDPQKFGRPRTETERAARNVVRLEYEGMTATVRPSGTEPKLKFYVHRLPAEDRAEAAGEPPLAMHERALAEAKLGAWSLYDALARRLEAPLSRAALALPDIIALEEKIRFDHELVPWLQSVLSQPAENPDEIEKELRKRGERLVPGADSLPALRPSIAMVAEDLRDDVDPVLLDRLLRR